MTREEFLEITYVSDLLEFADDVGYNFYDHDSFEVMDQDALDEYISSSIDDWAYDGWEYLRNRLDDVPTGYEYYTLNQWGELEGLCYNNANEIRGGLLDWCDENGIFDEESDEDEDENVENEHCEEEMVFESGFSISELLINIDLIADEVHKEREAIVIDDLLNEFATPYVVDISF